MYRRSTLPVKKILDGWAVLQSLSGILFSLEGRSQKPEASLQYLASVWGDYEERSRRVPVELVMCLTQGRKSPAMSARILRAPIGVAG